MNTIQRVLTCLAFSLIFSLALAAGSGAQETEPAQDDRESSAGEEPSQDAGEDPAEDASKEPAEDADKEPAGDADKEPAEDTDKEPAEDADKEPAEDADTAPPGQKPTSFFSLEYRSLARAREFIRVFVERYVLTQDYGVVSMPSSDQEMPLDWTFDGPATAADLRIRLQSFPTGRFEVYLFGPSKEIERLLANAETLKLELRSAPLGGPHDDVLVYPLSYVQADRALAVLSTLGYPVVEYGRLDPASDGTAPIWPDQIIRELQSQSDGEGAGSTSNAFHSRPVVIKLADSATTSLVLAEDGDGADSGGASTALTGGQPLTSVTDAVPQQQLMIVYDKHDPDSLDRLLRFIQNDLDIPSRQILIEAQVIEIDRDKARDLGISFRRREGKWVGDFGAQTEEGVSPLVVSFVRSRDTAARALGVQLRALEERGEVTVLSNPSVLVLDGRQARIKVAEEIPYTSQVTTYPTTETQTLDTKFLTAGIILNLRPRASFDNSEVSMQIETIISSADADPSRADATGVLVAPVIQVRQVQTLIRVANDTPFVIGGLVNLDQVDTRNGIPWLMNIPGLGRLFRRDQRQSQRKEVVVVITPHIIPENDRGLEFTAPRDSALLDRFDTRLFRNAYRIRHRDTFDVSYITESSIHRANVDKVTTLVDRLADATSSDRGSLMKNLREEPLTLAQIFLEMGLGDPPAETDSGSASAPRKLGPPQARVIETLQLLFDGRVPGEEILVHRMMIQLLERFDLHREVWTESLLLMDEDYELDPVELLPFSRWNCNPRKDTLSLSFDTTRAKDRLEPYRAKVSCLRDPRLRTEQGFREQLSAAYRAGRPTILLNDVKLGRRPRTADGVGEKMTPLEMLNSVLALRRLLEINDEQTFPRTLGAFHVGREILLPGPEELQDRTFLIDLRVARLFYETLNTHEAFHTRYEEQTAPLDHVDLEALRAASLAHSSQEEIGVQ